MMNWPYHLRSSHKRKVWEQIRSDDHCPWHGSVNKPVLKNVQLVLNSTSGLINFTCTQNFHCGSAIDKARFNFLRTLLLGGQIWKPMHTTMYGTSFGR